jgi:hypothetical protein
MKAHPSVDRKLILLIDYFLVPLGQNSLSANYRKVVLIMRNRFRPKLDFDNSPITAGNGGNGGTITGNAVNGGAGGASLDASGGNGGSVSFGHLGHHGSASFDNSPITAGNGGNGGTITGNAVNGGAGGVSLDASGGNGGSVSFG